jgi:hypothetical protein
LFASLWASASVLASDVDPMGFEKEHFRGSMTRAEATAASKTPLAVGMRIDDQGRLIVAPSILTRAQVEAETREAARLGLIRYGEGESVLGNPAREEQIALAGQRATGSVGAK